MSWKRQILYASILYFFITHSCAASYSYVDIMNYVIQYIKHNLREKRVTFLKSSQEFSYIQTSLMKLICSSFSNLFVDISEFSNASNYERMPRLKEVLSTKSESKGLSVIFANGEKGENVSQEILNYVPFIVHHVANTTRGKIIIFVFTTNVNTEFYGFFRFSWSYRFLHVTIIELHQQLISYGKLHNEPNILTNVVVHQYNPFRNAYTKEVFSANTKLFLNALENLSGYPLNAGFFWNYPLTYTLGNYSTLFTSLSGTESFIIQEIAKAMNFSVEIQIFNGTGFDIVQGLSDETIDFSISTIDIVGRPNMHHVIKIETSIFIYSFPIHLIVKQYPDYKTKIANNASIIAIAYVVIVMVFKLSVWLLKFDSKTWTVYRITQILIGNSLSIAGNRMVERIFFLCLVSAYMTFSPNISNMLLQINFGDKKFITFKTLQDAVDADIRSCMDSITMKNFKRYSNDPRLEKLLENMLADCDSCLDSLLTKDETLNGCYENVMLGKVLANIFSEKRDGWIVSIVREPLFPSWNAIGFTKTSPYVDRFNDILRRLSESGVVKWWLDNDMQMVTRTFYSKYNEVLRKKKSHRMNSKISSGNVGRKFSRDISILLLIAYVISCLIFVGEVVCNRIIIEFRRHV